MHFPTGVKNNNVRKGWHVFQDSERERDRVFRAGCRTQIAVFIDIYRDNVAVGFYVMKMSLFDGIYSGVIILNTLS